MKKTRLFTITGAGILALLLGVTVAGISAAAEDPDSAAEVKRETSELLQALKSYGAEQRDEALQKSRAALDRLDRRIEALETRMLEQWDEMDETARARARDSLQALREQRTRVAELYGSMKSGSAKAWGEIRQGFTNAYRALHDAWEQSEQDIDSGADR
jgi:hypothetical protein